MSLKKILKDRLGSRISEKELLMVRRSFEIIGDIVVVDIPDEIYHLKDEIVRAILTKHKHVKTVLRKIGEVRGDYRLAEYEIIYGRETETVCKEHGCKFLLDPTKVYYSVRLSGERERIFRLVNPGERILVMFAGVGPFAITIAKNARPKEVVGVELNPEAVKYFRKNVKLNRVENIVRVYEGDVRKIVPELEGSFDRILMPSPNNAQDFVDVAVTKAKKGSIIHYYTFAGVEEEKELQKRVEKLFSRYIKCKAFFMRRCGSFAPYVHRYVVDLAVG
ncbi:MAG: class I SAM-dependent methyltransferase family protein [Archaeoglobus sp.]|nr:MAG: class I SAM-dependent methyltransferase family protein [Archaeoglobus sp.]